MKKIFATSSYVPPDLIRKNSNNKISQLRQKEKSSSRAEQIHLFGFLLSLSLQIFFLAVDEEKAIFVHRHPLLVPYLD